MDQSTNTPSKTDRPGRSRKKDGPAPWKKSKAKQQLREDIIDGTVKPSDGPSAVWASREIYQQYNKTKFSTNLRNLCLAIVRDQAWAVSDKAAVDNDLQLHLPAAVSHRGYPHWDGSDAERFLKQDMKEGMLNK
jgi:hypothetical protein